MKNAILMAFVFTLFAGCESKKPEAPKEVTQTVDWCLKHDQERKATLEKCRNNPGELGNTPNCVNARTAGSMKSVVSTKKYDF